MSLENHKIFQFTKHNINFVETYTFDVDFLEYNFFFLNFTIQSYVIIKSSSTDTFQNFL